MLPRVPARLPATAEDSGSAGVRTTVPGEPLSSRSTGSLVVVPSASARAATLAYALSGPDDLVDVLRLGDDIARAGRLGSNAGRIGRLVAAPDGSLIAVTRTVDWIAGTEGTDSILRLTVSRPRQ